MSVVFATLFENLVCISVDTLECATLYQTLLVVCCHFYHWAISDRLRETTQQACESLVRVSESY